MTLLSEISWVLSEPINSACCYCKDGEPNYLKASNELDKLISLKNIILLVPIQRFCENLYPLTIEGPVTGKKILDSLYVFYNNTRIVKKYFNDLEDDCLGFTESVREKIRGGEEVHWIDVIGGLIFFEGISKLIGNVYFLGLGS